MTGTTIVTLSYNCLEIIAELNATKMAVAEWLHNHILLCSRWEEWSEIYPKKVGGFICFLNCFDL